MSIADGLIVSVSGIRGVIGKSLKPADALAFASALAPTSTAAASS